jgi:hypothetical protein
MIGTLAMTGAVAGGVTGSVVSPEITGVVASLAVAGFGLGGIVGTLFAGGWRPPPELTEAAPESDLEPTPLPQPEPPRQPESPPAPVAEPPAPEGEEPGWYPFADGTRHYWDGGAWTDHVWRERPAGGGRRAAKPRQGRRSP